MIKSVSFPETGTGYLYEKYEKPEKPYEYRYQSVIWDNDKKKTVFTRAKDNPDYVKAYEIYKKDLRFYNKHKNEYKCKAAKNLIGKTFDFEDGKINIIFGPNGSGKTTILKAISGEIYAKDGFTMLREPIAFGWDVKNYNPVSIIELDKCNSSIVEWDGIPVYYDNFSTTLRNSGSYIGSLEGDLMSFSDEMNYRMFSGNISAGQNTAYLFNKIMGVASKKRSLKEIIDINIGRLFKGSINSTWEKCRDDQVAYFKDKFPDTYEKEAPITVMFDEMDKSLDIQTIWRLYNEVFPRIVKETGSQIICVTHSPFILSKDIFENPLYNIISVDQEYTDSCKEMLKNVTF